MKWFVKAYSFENILTKKPKTKKRPKKTKRPKTKNRSDVAVLWCRPPRDNPRTLNTQLNAALANRKLSRFKEFAALYPECCWVFLGDNGQVRSFLHQKSLTLLAKGHSNPYSQFTP